MVPILRSGAEVREAERLGVLVYIVIVQAEKLLLSNGRWIPSELQKNLLPTGRSAMIFPVDREILPELINLGLVKPSLDHLIAGDEVLIFSRDARTVSSDIVAVKLTASGWLVTKNAEIVFLNEGLKVLPTGGQSPVVISPQVEEILFSS